MARTFTYKSEEDLEKAIDKYFEILDTKAPTITGLALHLGFNSRRTFYNYGSNPYYKKIIDRARLRIEESYEQRLHGGKPTGAIFALKNLGWRDNLDVTSDGKSLVKEVHLPANNRENS